MAYLKRIIKSIFQWIDYILWHLPPFSRIRFFFAQNDRHHEVLHEILVDFYLQKNLWDSSRYAEPKRLNRFERQVFSQNGEDGILEEIFRRIGTTNRFFVEFGVENGIECNTAYLLAQGWRGLWIEGDRHKFAKVCSEFRRPLDRKQLQLQNRFVTAETIESIFDEENIPAEFDLLGIDIDGNDYWVWKAIEHYRPRVVVVEYNASYPSTFEWIRHYDPAAVWDQGSNYWGASLKSLEKLGLEKGYSLVGCNFTGVNAFFVDQQTLKDKFSAPYTSENHYEPPRPYLQRNFLIRRRFQDM